MKALFLLLVSVVLFSSCEKVDDDPFKEIPLLLTIQEITTVVITTTYSNITGSCRANSALYTNPYDHETLNNLFFSLLDKKTVVSIDTFKYEMHFRNYSEAEERAKSQERSDSKTEQRRIGYLLLAFVKDQQRLNTVVYGEECYPKEKFLLEESNVKIYGIQRYHTYPSKPPVKIGYWESIAHYFTDKNVVINRDVKVSVIK